MVGDEIENREENGGGVLEIALVEPVPVISVVVDDRTEANI